MNCPSFFKPLVRFFSLATCYLLLTTFLVHPVWAQVPTATPTQIPAPTATPTPGSGFGLVPTAPVGWVENYSVTELGRSAERARELLSWTFSHPPVYRHPVLAQMWSISRNIAYVLVIFTIIMFAVGFVLAQRRGMTVSSNLVSILFKIAGVLLFITFSYLLVLVILESSETLMRIFIERIGGKDLFNIFFVGGQGGAANTEKNYTEFFGYYNVGPRYANLEMINTSMLLIRLTNLTYYVMSIMLILRHIILWFLLVLSPFLALLLPFVFIRNTGWIWIGVFLQWVFYGPLFALFLVALTKIWIAGIPYSFDFNRTPAHAPSGVDTCAATPFKTSINILYGGPAQTLSICNSANYIDTFAEYVIALVMLWVATFLPWLLLRIFRDYCCDILAQNQAVLVQMLDRLRSFGQPPPPPPIIGPTGTTSSARELPFRRTTTTPAGMATTKITEIEKNIENVRTEDIVSAMNLSVSSIQDIARLDISHRQQEDKRSSLESIRNPATVTDRDMRESYSSIRSELFSRASQGDQVAQRVIAATEGRISDLSRAGVVGARSVTTPDVAARTGVTEEQVRTVLATVPTMGMPTVGHVRDASAKAGVSVSKVNEILTNARPSAMVSAVTATVIAGRAMTATEIANKTSVSEDKVRSILTILPGMGVPNKLQIQQAAQKTGVPETTVAQIVSLARPETIGSTAGKPKVVPGVAAPAPTPVTVDDYEDVKSMWVNHYKNSDVPISDKIKSREQWLEEDAKKLTNIINLVTSTNVALRKQGTNEVSSILPFLLLGGFSDAETVIYLKAKQAAANQVLKDLTVETKAKEAGKVEGQEDLVDIEGKKAEAKPQEMKLAQSLEQNLPPASTLKMEDEKDKVLPTTSNVPVEPQQKEGETKEKTTEMEKMIFHEDRDVNKNKETTEKTMSTSLPDETKTTSNS